IKSSGGVNMTKMRIYEYAKQRNVSSKEVIAKLKELNINVSNHMVTIDEETIKKLDNIDDKEKKGNAQQHGSSQQPARNKQPREQRHQAKTRAGRGDFVRSQTNDFDQEDDTLPKKVKVKSAPKIREGKKGTQELQSKENKVFSKVKSKQKQRGPQRGRKGR